MSQRHLNDDVLCRICDSPFDLDGNRRMCDRLEPAEIFSVGKHDSCKSFAIDNSIPENLGPDLGHGTGRLRVWCKHFRTDRISLDQQKTGLNEQVGDY